MIQDYHSAGPLAHFNTTELIDALATGVIVLDAHFCVVYANVGVQDLLGIGLNQAPDAQDLRAAQFWLKFFALSELAQRRPRELSYGQMRRALLARAMAGAPRLLLLDEPFTGLDPLQRALHREMLSGLMMRGITLIMAVHHTEDLPAGITHVLRLHNRRAGAFTLRNANPVVGTRASDAA